MKEQAASLIIDVPIEFYEDFKLDPLIAWTSYGDRPLHSKFSYFEDKAAIYDMVERDRVNPFDSETFLFDDDFVCKDNFYRFIHVDLAISGDAAGIAMCHVPDWIVGKGGSNEPRPVYKIDFMSRFVAPRGGEIMIESIRDVIYEVDRRGFPILLITYDRFQSADSIQILRSKGFVVSNLSLDRTATYPVVDMNAKDGIKRISTGSGKFSDIAAWAVGKNAINSRRVRVPFYLPVSDTSIGDGGIGLDDFGQPVKDVQYITHIQREALFAYYDPKAVKVKEGPKGTIDLLEAVVGAIFNASANVTDQLEIESGIERRKRLAKEAVKVTTEFERQEMQAEIDDFKGVTKVEGESDSIFEKDSWD